MAVKVLGNNGSGSISGIDYVTSNADVINVVNMSLGGTGKSTAFRTAIANSVGKGVVYVVTAGNSSRDIYGGDHLFDTGDESIPAAYPEVLAVSAMADFDGVGGAADSDPDDDRFAWWFSNFSSAVVGGNPVTSDGAAIDVAAPGVSILSTYKDGGYATLSGTSMASPHVAGSAALWIAVNGSLQNVGGVSFLRQQIIDSAEPQSLWGSGNTGDDDGNPEGLVDVPLLLTP